MLSVSMDAVAVEGEPAVAVLDVRAGNGITAAQAAKARTALAEGFARFRVRVIEDHPAVLGAHGPGADAATQAGIAEARKLARDGKKLFDDLDPAGAEGKFRAAANLFEQNVGGLSSLSDLVGTYLYLARVFFSTERELLARDIFHRIVQLQPDLVLNRAEYPPGMIAVFDDVKKTTLSSPLGTMNIDSVPAPARVFLDARDRGATPVELVNIPAGIHVVTVRRPGYASWSRPVDVTSFRVDKLKAELVLDRFSNLDPLFANGGLEQKDPLGLTVGDWVDAVAAAAGVDVAFVGRLSKGGQLEVRAYKRDGKTFAAVRTLSFDSARDAEAVAATLLQAAVADGWLPAITARRNVSSGGGALDENARLLFRAAIVPTTALSGGGKNFPSGPGAGLRVGADYRIGPRLLLTAETGFDGVVQSNVVLKGTGGNVVASSGAKVQAVYTSIPLDVGARWYFGVSTLAPFATGGLGVRWDSLTYRESLPFDKVRGSSGLGFDAFLGGGVDYALSTRSGLFLEGRLHGGTVGVGDARLTTRSNPPVPSRTIPVDAGFYTGMRVYLGYLQVF